jgi:AraC-like DNA-binding protein
MPASLLAFVDNLLAFGSLALFAICTALAIRDTRHILQGRLLIGLLVSAKFQALTIVPGADVLPTPLFAAAKVIGIPNLGLLWWFCLSLFRDEFRISPQHWAGFIGLALTPSVYALETLGYRFPFGGIVSQYGDIPPALMIGHVFWVALSERRSDLVESRRRARLWIVGALLAALLVSLFSETMDGDLLPSILRNGLGVIPAQLLLLFWLARVSPKLLQFKPVTKTATGEPQIDPKDISLHRRLMQAIEEEQVYLRPGLSIEELADLLKVPTHQLRHLINTGMGHRNFASFLNGYRLDHAKAALADSDRARETVLAIAYEAGFASLQSFNRVFKDVLGQTPTDFRAAALTAPSQN